MPSVAAKQVSKTGKWYSLKGGSGSPGNLLASPISGSSCNGRQPNTEDSQVVRLGFFECHVCLLRKHGGCEVDASPSRKQFEPPHGSEADSPRLYRLSVSNVPSSLQRKGLETAMHPSKKGVFLILHPSHPADTKCESEQNSESRLRSWRMTSVIDSEDPRKQQSDMCYPSYDKKEPWDEVISRTARWLIVERLNATILVLGCGRSHKQALFPTSSQRKEKQESFGVRWRPCVAQRACAEAFALSKLRGNPCEQNKATRCPQGCLSNSSSLQ